MLLKNMERDKYTSIIHEELNKLGLEFQRYKERWDKLSKSVQAVNRDIESVHITTEKITKKFDMINQVRSMASSVVPMMLMPRWVRGWARLMAV